MRFLWLKQSKVNLVQSSFNQLAIYLLIHFYPKFDIYFIDIEIHLNQTRLEIQSKIVLRAFETSISRTEVSRIKALERV